MKPPNESRSARRRAVAGGGDTKQLKEALCPMISTKARSITIACTALLVCRSCEAAELGSISADLKVRE
jgi:hypothetical protein